jgi:hypothetical protein
MDPYKARQDVTEKMLLEVPEAQLHNSDICDSKTETLQLCRKAEESDMKGALFVRQLRTEKTDRKFYQCAECVCKDHCIKKIQIT